MTVFRQSFPRILNEYFESLEMSINSDRDQKITLAIASGWGGFYEEVGRNANVITIVLHSIAHEGNSRSINQPLSTFRGILANDERLLSVLHDLDTVDTILSNEFLCPKIADVEGDTGGTEIYSLPCAVNEVQVPYAEIAPNTICILPDIVHFVSNFTPHCSPEQDLEDILDVEVAFEAPVRRCLELMNAQGKNNFINFSANVLDSRRAEQWDQINSLEAQIRDTEYTIRCRLSEIREAKEAIEAIDQRKRTAIVDTDYLSAQYDRISTHALIEPGTLTVDRTGTFKFRTIPLDIFHEDFGNIYLGKFEITTDMNTFSVIINNLDNSVGGRDHPHVEAGNPCWGGYENEVRQYFHINDFSGFIEFLFGYLQSYNAEDDWGRYIRYWLPEEAQGEEEDREEY